MKTFKTIESCLQIGLLILAGLGLAFDNTDQLNPMLFIFLFGLTQLISLLVNKAAGKQVWKKTAWRKYHLIGTGLVVLLLIVAFLQDSSRNTGDKDDKYAMPGLETAIWATIPAILLCLFYVIITIAEWKNLSKKTGAKELSILILPVYLFHCSWNIKCQSWNEKTGSYQ